VFFAGGLSINDSDDTEEATVWLPVIISCLKNSRKQMVSSRCLLVFANAFSDDDLLSYPLFNSSGNARTCHCHY